MEIVTKRCKICGYMRKFVLGSERELKLVCGDCWEDILKKGWNKE